MFMFIVAVTNNNHNNPQSISFIPLLESLAIYSTTKLRLQQSIASAQMTIPTAGICISDGHLQVYGKTLLSSVPPTVSLTPSIRTSMGAFLGASTSESKSYHVFPLGVLQGLRLLSCFRFKLWWMTQTMGTCGRDVPLETQFLLVECKGGSPMTGETDVGSQDDTPAFYTIFLPLLEGPFRASLQGNGKNELELCFESGDPDVTTLGGVHSVFVYAGSDPFQVISEAVRIVEMHLKTFQVREKKKMPGILDWFGWCTWNAFYRDVSAKGVMEGIKSLIAGGTPPRFVLVDDGWQSAACDEQPYTETVSNGSIFTTRLTGIKENYKFRKDGKDGQKQEDPALGLQHVVREAKEIYDVKYMYLWHAACGYWGGVRPGVPGMEQYEAFMTRPVKSLGIAGNQLDDPGLEAMELITKHGMGLVHPTKAFQFYDEYHSYLAAAGVDGVKVDVSNILETLGSGLGGRVAITRQFSQSLEASIALHFPDNGCISSMVLSTDWLYSLKHSAIVRASDDFFPEDLSSHAIHIATVTYTSLFVGEFMQPDWDMFHSNHSAAEYHAAARAVGGCGIYCSDKPGDHNFDLLKKLVLPDGSVLRAQLPGRPSRDCLFTDPTKDGQSLLKIWNMNKYTGIIGAFNCQGAAWCRLARQIVTHDTEPKIITGHIHARDVELLPTVAGDDWNGDCIMYSHCGGELFRLSANSTVPVTLKVLEYEVLTVVPVKDLVPGVSFAPIGLIKMLNAGGAIDKVECEVGNIVDEPKDELTNLASDGPNTTRSSFLLVKMKIHGCGEFGVYSSIQPKKILVDFQCMDFTYDIVSGLATVMLPIPNEEGYFWDVRVEI